MSDETKHSPEPWSHHGSELRDAEDFLTGEAFEPETTKGTFEDNARRIVACVNACAGIPTEALESGEFRSAVEGALMVLAAVGGTMRLNDDGWALHRGMAEAKAAKLLRALGRLK